MKELMLRSLSASCLPRWQWLFLIQGELKRCAHGKQRRKIWEAFVYLLQHATMQAQGTTPCLVSLVLRYLKVLPLLLCRDSLTRQLMNKKNGIRIQTRCKDLMRLSDIFMTFFRFLFRLIREWANENINCFYNFAVNLLIKKTWRSVCLFIRQAQCALYLVMCIRT